MLLEARSDTEVGMVASQVRSWHEAVILFIVSLFVLSVNLVACAEIRVHSICQVKMCLVIAAVFNDATSCGAEWLAGDVSQTAKLGVKTYAETDAIQADANLRHNPGWHSRPL